MITVRRAATLGVAQSDTLMLRCHFAFADYQDTAYQHEGRLRAVNEASLRPLQAYHLTDEAEVDIVTWVRAGRLTASVDDFAAEEILAEGLHLIKTGSGCSRLIWQAGAEGAAFLQFWFLPDTEGGLPAQESRSSLTRETEGGFTLLASGFPEDGPEEDVMNGEAPVALSASARLLHAAIPAGEGAAYNTSLIRELYLVVVEGVVCVQDIVLKKGDAMAVCDEQSLTVMAQENAVVMLADVAAA